MESREEPSDSVEVMRRRKSLRRRIERIERDLAVLIRDLTVRTTQDPIALTVRDPTAQTTLDPTAQAQEALLDDNRSLNDDDTEMTAAKVLQAVAKETIEFTEFQDTDVKDLLRCRFTRFRRSLLREDEPHILTTRKNLHADELHRATDLLQPTADLQPTIDLHPTIDRDTISEIKTAHLVQAMMMTI